MRSIDELEGSGTIQRPWNFGLCLGSQVMNRTLGPTASYACPGWFRQSTNWVFWKWRQVTNDRHGSRACHLRPACQSSQNAKARFLPRLPLATRSTFILTAVYFPALLGGLDWTGLDLPREDVPSCGSALARMDHAMQVRQGWSTLDCSTNKG